MGENEIRLRSGELVEVRSADEIARTLDADGALDGLPFMPEMMEYCGRRFRVLRQALKTCVEVGPGDYPIREFRRNDVVLLEGLRCSGATHGGCQRACMFFWRKAWLRKVAGGQAQARVDEAGSEQLRAKLKTMTTPTRYFCQSTELIRVTKPDRIHPMRILLKCFQDVQSGAVGVMAMSRLILVPICRKIRDKLFGRPRLRGTLTRTPVGTLGLQPGEEVEIRSLAELQMTLDGRGRNRGLVCDIELKKFCGTRDRVRSRLDRMISEATGEMRKVEGTVLLEGNLCLCARATGGCPRLEYCYWREVWLKRVNEAPPSASPPQQSATDQTGHV